MDSQFATASRDEPVAARQRFESFKLGGAAPPSGTPPRHSRRGSHSRNTSVSSSISILSHSSSASSLSHKPTPSNDLSSLSFSLSNGPSKRPNSHHRRRSSVSTRRESAEMMGVSIPDLPPSASSDNINLGDKDSIRRRALWALEGKPDMAFSKVEIPDLPTPDLEKVFEFPTKPSFPPGNGFSGGLNSMISKRDSFKLLSSSISSKDQLHTLVEEEEEEEDAEEQETESSDPTTPAITVAVTKPSPVRPRPATLNLRPLSLTPDNLSALNNIGLPTPLLTPSPRAGLRSLSLAPSPTIPSTHSTTLSDDTPMKSFTNAMKRQSLVLTPSSNSALLLRGPSPVDCDSPSPISSDENKITRRSSISYKSSIELPTPEMTPTLDRRHSESNVDDEVAHSRPLSASEQHFLFKSHNALLTRITDLERALSSRSHRQSRSRPLSAASDASSSFSEPSDEMLQLIADLKAERDELKRDVDGWRTRVEDLNKQLGVFAKRVENERRDAWVARSRIGMLEIEKAALEKVVETSANEITDTHKECQRLREECQALQQTVEKLNKDVAVGREAEEECVRLRAALAAERAKREQLERELERADLLATPTPNAFETKFTTAFMARKRGLGFSSIDSEGSSTDVEPDTPTYDTVKAPFGFPLKVVQEENEDDDDMSEDNGLAGYEDEEELDLSLDLSSSSSIGSEDEFSRLTDVRFPATPSPSKLEPAPLIRSASASPTPAQHTPRASLSKTWTFPKGMQAAAARPQEEVDHFFGCLDDLDASPPLHSAIHSQESSKNLFVSGLKMESEFAMSEEEDFPAFVLPVSDAPRMLEAVMEEEEEEEEEESVDAHDEDVFGEVGGISIVLTPAEAVPEAVDELSFSSAEASSPHRELPGKPAPVFNFFDADDEEEKENVPFHFGRPAVKKVEDDAMGLITPPPSIPRAVNTQAAPSKLSPSSPSSIPRSVITKTTSIPATTVTATPPPPPKPAFASYAASSFVTPPTKRGGTMPSFIPQPVSSPSPLKTVPSSRQRVTAPSTFIRQPQRKPAPAVPSGSAPRAHNNGSAFKPQIATSTLADARTVNNAPTTLRRFRDAEPSAHAGAHMNSVDLSDPSATPSIPAPTDIHSTSAASLSSLMTSPLAGRLSLQTLTSFIPYSWSARASPAEAAVSIASALCSLPDSSSTSSAGSSGGVDSQQDQPQASRAMNVNEPSAPRARVPPAYVSREKQLQKLRSRLAQEAGLAVDICRKCEHGAVVL